MHIETIVPSAGIHSQIAQFHIANEKREEEKKTARNELSLFKVEEERRGVIQGV